MRSSGPTSMSKAAAVQICMLTWARSAPTCGSRRIKRRSILQGGGIEIWPVRMPEDWDFKHANVERDGIRHLLAGKGDPIVVPHRCNRLVLFEANLFHRTSPGSFKTGYENRRVNITFLYDRMEAPSRGHVG